MNNRPRLTLAVLFLVCLSLIYRASSSFRNWYPSLMEKLGHPLHDTVVENVEKAIDAENWPVARSLIQEANRHFPGDARLKEDAERVDRWSAESQKEHDRVSKIKAIAPLVRAQSKDDLQSAYSKIPHDYVTRVVYEVRRYELIGQPVGEGLLNVFPQSLDQSEEIFNTLDVNRSLDPKADDSRLQQVYYNFYKYAVLLMEKSPSNLPSFFRVLDGFGKTDNVEQEPMLCELASEIYKKIPEAYLTAAEKMDKESKKHALDCRVRPDVP